jgi:hypothetical protein
MQRVVSACCAALQLGMLLVTHITIFQFVTLCDNVSSKFRVSICCGLKAAKFSTAVISISISQSNDSA